MGRGAVYTGIFVGTLATYAPIPAVFFFFLAPFDVRPGPGYALAQARLMGSHPHQGPAIAGHTRHETRAKSKKKLAEIRKAMSVGLAVIAAGGDERRFFSYPSFAGGIGELRGARSWLTWRCWPENATPVVPCLPLSRPLLRMGRNGRGSGR